MESGQASLEHIGIVAVVAAVLALAAGLVPGAAAEVPKAVVAGIHRALCLVGGGDCLGDAGPRPCVTASTRHAREKEASLAIARFADGRSVLREERSDGSVVVTVVRFDEAGAGVVLGGEASVGGHTTKASIDASLAGRAGDGRTWVLPDGAAADRLIERLASEDGRLGGGLAGLARFVAGDHGDADRVFVHFGARGEADGAVKLLKLGAAGTALMDLADGVRVDRRTGERTLFFTRDRGLLGALTAPVGRAAGGLNREGTAELTLGSDGDPRELLVRVVGDVDGAAKLGPYSSAGGDRVEAEARIDLTGVRLRDPGELKDLVANLGDRARIDVRLYATTHSESRRGAKVGLLAKLGLEEIRTVDGARLVAAAGREPGLGWSRRLDCLMAA